MSNYASLKATINANIKTNGNQEITGSVLNSVLNAMVNTLGAGYQYAGVATPTTNPGTPDQRVFYIAWQPGTYSNFGGIIINNVEVCLLRYDTVWHKDITGVCSKDYISDELGYARSYFSVTPGVAHSSSLDIINCDIPVGEQFILYNELFDNAEITNYELYFLYDGASSATDIGAYSFGTKRRVFTASQRIRQIRFYINGNRITNAGNVQYTLLSRWAYQWDFINTAYNNSIVNSAKIQDGYNNTYPNIELDETNKKVIIKKNGFGIITIGRNRVGVSLENDMELSYSGSRNGAWVFSKDALMNNATVALTTSNVFFADVNTANFNNNVILFYCYQGNLIPIGLFGPQLLQRQIGKIKTTIQDLDIDHKSKFGEQRVEFPITVGSSHSSTLDTINCDIKAGEKYVIISELEDGADVSFYGLYVWYRGSSSATFITSYTFGTRTLTAANDIYKIGFYINSANIIASGNLNFTILSNWALKIYNNGLNVEQLFSDNIIAFDCYNNSAQNIIIDEENKSVTIKATGLRIIYKNVSFAITGTQDFVMSYNQNVAANGGWMLKRSVVTGGNITLDSSNIFYAAVGTANFNNNILLFGVYYGTLMPVGVLGPYLQQARLLTPLRKNMFQSAYNPVSIDDKLESFAELFNNSGVCESFIFMTDPHLFATNNNFEKETFKRYISLLQKYYNSVPVDWMICGGDWLTSGDYKDVACAKLGYIDATMRKLFKHYFPVIGNHDTNYQGVVSSEDSNRGDLSHQTLVNLMFRENGNTYYKFKGNNTQFYVFDTGIDWETAMDSFKWGQIDWFARSLVEEDAEHAVIIQHIFYNSGTNVNPMAENIQAIAGAYNSRSSVTLNGITYNFSGCTGKIACAIAGHSHFDSIITQDVSVPVWLTTNMMDGNTPTFDLCVIDYTAGKMKSVRVGTGSNREMTLA